MKFSRFVLIIGDLLVLLHFALLGSVSPPPTLTPVRDAMWTYLVFAALWLIIGLIVKVFDADVTNRRFFMRLLFGWLIAGGAGLIIYKVLWGNFYFNGWTLLWQWSEAFFNLLLWRIGFMILQFLLHRGKFIRLVTIIGLAVGFIGLFGVIGFRLYVIAQYQDDINTLETAPAHSAALVFGAGLWYDGTPSTVLMNRVATAVELYHSGQVERLIMTGDGRFSASNEPEAMRQLALEAGVPDSAIVVDLEGVRTYNSCYRAYHVYDASELILVTQKYHLIRALYICDALGLDVLGVAPIENPTALRSIIGREIREVAATVLAWWELTITQPIIS